MTLSNYTQGRDNNFNLIRIMAALAVLVTHSFALAIGTGAAEPFRDSLGMTMGTIAVDIFFVTSGFLVTGSLLTRHSALEFLWARTLRVFPALLVMLLLTVFGLGPLVTSWPLSAYLTDAGTYGYLLKCATLVSGVQYNLPGVFADNPFKSAVNGSLWSLPYEIRMYAIVVMVWLVFRRIQRVGGRAFFNRYCVRGPYSRPVRARASYRWSSRRSIRHTVLYVFLRCRLLSSERAHHTLSLVFLFLCGGAAVIGSGQPPRILRRLSADHRLFGVVSGLHSLRICQDLQSCWRLFLWRLHLCLSRSTVGCRLDSWSLGFAVVPHLRLQHPLTRGPVLAPH